VLQGHGDHAKVGTRDGRALGFLSFLVDLYAGLLRGNPVAYGKVAFAVFIAIWAITLWGSRKPDDRRAILKLLRRRDALNLYERVVGKVLVGLRNLLSPGHAEEEWNKKPEGKLAQLLWYSTPCGRDAVDLKRLEKTAFSWPVMDAALKVAVFYLFSLMLLQWAWTGDDTGLAGFPILVKEDRYWFRVALMSSLGFYVAIGTLVIAMRQGSFQRLADSQHWPAATGASASMIVIVFMFTFGFEVSANLANLLIAAAVVVLGIARAGTYAIAFLVGFASAVTVAIGWFVAGSFASVALIALFFAMANAVAVAAAAGYFVQLGRPALVYGALVIGGMVLVTGSLATQGNNLGESARIVIFAVGLLPLCNAIFDYLSYGLTLTFIKKGMKARNLWSLVLGIVDAGIAVCLLIGLGTFLTLLIGAINGAAGQMLINLPGIFADLNDPATRGEYTWLYLSLTTTLLPTALHILIVVFTATVWVPLFFREWIIALLETAETSNLKPLVGSGFFAALATGYICLVAFALYHLVRFPVVYFDDLALFVLRQVEAIAGAFGLL